MHSCVIPSTFVLAPKLLQDHGSQGVGSLPLIYATTQTVHGFFQIRLIKSKTQNNNNKNIFFRISFIYTYLLIYVHTEKRPFHLVLLQRFFLTGTCFIWIIYTGLYFYTQCHVVLMFARFFFNMYYLLCIILQETIAQFWFEE